jgi:hypothetical protein
MHILQYHSYLTNVPIIKYFHKYMIEHVSMLVTTANSPLDRQLDGYALTTHTYQSVEVIDSFIITEADGIHTITRHMDNEIESKQ